MLSLSSHRYLWCHNKIARHFYTSDRAFEFQMFECLLAAFFVLLRFRDRSNLVFHFFYLSKYNRSILTGYVISLPVPSVWNVERCLRDCRCSSYIDQCLLKWSFQCIQDQQCIRYEIERQRHGSASSVVVLVVLFIYCRFSRFGAKGNWMNCSIAISEQWCVIWLM